MDSAPFFASNAAFLSASMELMDRLIGRAMDARAGGLRLPRGLTVTAELAAEALSGRQIRRDEALCARYARWRAAAEQSAERVPLLRLCELMGLTAFGRFCAAMALCAVCDRKYELLFGYLNDNIQRSWPNLGCAAALYRMVDEVEEGEVAAFFAEPEGGNAYLFETPQEGDGLAAPLRLRGKARLAALESDALSPVVAGYAQRLQPDGGPLRYGLEDNRLPELLLRLLDGGRSACVQLLGERGAGRKRLLQRIAADTGLQVLCVRADLLPGAAGARQAGMDIAAEALLGGALVLLDGCDEAEEAALRPLLGELTRRLKVTLLSARQPLRLPEGPLDVRVEFPLPSAAQARCMWAAELAAYPHEDFSVRALADRVELTPGRAQDALAQAALDAAAAGEERLSLRRVMDAVRRGAVHQMDGQARRINAFYTWDDLVVAPETERELRLFCDRARYRGVVMEDWDFKSRLAYGRAVSALFYGVPGTGKTMAAQVIANDLDLDLYRVDLSQIMNKYVGETEKNLARIFDEAAHCGGILFFDEADALFAKRTEIADSKDKYANAETAFLLQKIEEFDGMVILATNLAYNFDDAFKRRINYMVNFTLPDAGQRRELWRKVFPAAVRAQERLDLDFLAESFELTGSAIKAIAVSAAYMAAGEGSDIDMRHIVRALKHEVRKSGGVLIKATLREYDVD